MNPPQPTRPVCLHCSNTTCARLDSHWGAFEILLNNEQSILEQTFDRPWCSDLYGELPPFFAAPPLISSRFSATEDG